MSEVIDITAGNWDEKVTRSDVPVLVAFSADWCGHCVRLKPVLAALARRYDGRVTVGRVDSDRNRQLCRTHHVTGLPTTLLFQAGDSNPGDEVDRFVGFRDEQTFSRAVDRLLSEGYSFSPFDSEEPG